MTKAKARSKASSTKSASNGHREIFVDDEGYYCLKGDRFWKWRALDAELRAATAELDSVSRQIQVEISKHPELAALLQQKAALAGTISTAQSELLTVQTEIEKLMGVSLKECAFDDKSGRLYHLASDGSRGDPMKKPRSARRS